jgi:hypothetical protein
MRRFALGVALGVLLVTAQGGAALAAQPVAAVLTPEQLGLTEPGQGFYPYFTGFGGSTSQQPLAGFFGTGTLTGVGITALTATGATVGQPGFSGFSTFPTLVGPGGSPLAFGAASPLGTGCGVFTISFCPLYTSQPIGTGLNQGFGFGAGGFGFGGLGGFGGGLGGPVIVVR